MQTQSLSVQLRRCRDDNAHNSEPTQMHIIFYDWHIIALLATMLRLMVSNAGMQRTTS